MAPARAHKKANVLHVFIFLISEIITVLKQDPVLLIKEIGGCYGMTVTPPLPNSHIGLYDGIEGGDWGGT